MGTVMSFYEIRDNCGIKYADYYYEKYKKENDITFTMENTDTYLFLGKSLTITMKEETTIEEVCNFVNYLKQNVKQKFELYIKR